MHLLVSKVSLFFLGFHFSGRRVVGHGGGVDQVLVGSKMEHGGGKEMSYVWQGRCPHFAPAR